MRKILLLFPIVLCSCANNQNVDEFSNKEIESVEISISSLKSDFQSRVYFDVSDKLSKWQENDTVGIFPNKGGQVEFPITEESYNSTKAVFDGGGWALKRGYNYSAYYPYNFYNRNVNKIPFSFVGQIQDGDNTSSHMGKYTSLISKPTSVNEGALIFQMGFTEFFFRVALTLPEAKTYTSLELHTDGKIIPVKKSYNILANDYEEEVIEYSDHLGVELKNITTTAPNQVIKVWMVFPYMNPEGKTLTAVVKDSQGGVYVGDVMRAGSTFIFGTNSIVRNYVYALTATPQPTNGVTGSIENWEIGEVIMGSAN